MRKVLAIPDLHAPFTDLAAVDYFVSTARMLQPDIIFQLGDAYDCYSFSKFPHSPNIMTPRQEMIEGHQLLSAFWKRMRDACPTAELIQITGNHEARISKRILEAAPAALDFLEVGSLYEFGDVSVVRDPRKETEIDGILYIHGFLSTPAKHLAYFNQSVVHGHTHRMSIISRPTHSRMIFAAECGHAGDLDLVPMQYTPTVRSHWTISAMLISEYGPHPFIKPKTK